MGKAFINRQSICPLRKFLESSRPVTDLPTTKHPYSHLAVQHAALISLGDDLALLTSQIVLRDLSPFSLLISSPHFLPLE